MLALRREAAESDYGPEDNLESDTMGEPSGASPPRSTWAVGRRQARGDAGPCQPDHRGSFFCRCPRTCSPGVGQEWFIRVRPTCGPGRRHREPGLVVTPAGDLAGGGVAEGWSGEPAQVLRFHGGRLVAAERRSKLEAPSTSWPPGFTLVNSFAVDDNVYLVLAADDD